MSRFQLIEIEEKETESFPDYASLDLYRETEYRVYILHQDQYGNKSSTLLMSTPNIIYARKFIRSCRLIDGIVMEDI